MCVCVCLLYFLLRSKNLAPRRESSAIDWWWSSCWQVPKSGVLSERDLVSKCQHLDEERINDTKFIRACAFGPVSILLREKPYTQEGALGGFTLCANDHRRSGGGPFFFFSAFVLSWPFLFNLGTRLPFSPMMALTHKAMFDLFSYPQSSLMFKDLIVSLPFFFGGAILYHVM